MRRETLRGDLAGHCEHVDARLQYAAIRELTERFRGAAIICLRRGARREALGASNIQIYQCRPAFELTPGA